MLVIKNCKFVRELTEGTLLSEGDLFIDGGKIANIAPCGTEIPEGSEVIDAAGATVMPGIIDMHVHLGFLSASLTEVACMETYEKLTRCIDYAQYMLSIGITTVRDCGDTRDLPARGVKKLVEGGYIDGPRVICSGKTLIPIEASSLPSRGLDSDAQFTGPEEARKMAREQFAHGAEFIKLYGTGSMMALGAEPGVSIMDEDEVAAAVKVAKSKNSYCAMHCHGADAIDSAIKLGVRTIEHASFIRESTLKAMSGRKDVGIVPTLATMYDLMQAGSGLDPVLANLIDVRSKQVFENLSKAPAYNVLVGWGTDTQVSAYKARPGQEFKMRKENLGYDNVEILKQATINSAILLGLEDSIGSIKEGKCADVIIVNGDPAADISVMYEPPAHVIKGGKVIR